MRKIAIAGFLLALLAVSSVLTAAEPTVMPEPTKGHRWLLQLAGQWKADLEVFVEPGKPHLKIKSTENTRKIGNFWIVSESKVLAPGPPYERALLLGYDSWTDKYMGTLVDSIRRTSASTRGRWTRRARP